MSQVFFIYFNISGKGTLARFPLLHMWAHLSAHQSLQPPSSGGRLTKGGSPASSEDDLSILILHNMARSALCASLVYAELLSVARDIVQCCQLLVCKGCLPFLFQSHRPIKLGSALNRVIASVVQIEVDHRYERDGSWAGSMVAYRKEMPPHTLAFMMRAAMHTSLLQTGEAHIPEGDESGAFDRLFREDMALYSAAWPSRCLSFWIMGQEFLWTAVEQALDTTGACATRSHGHRVGLRMNLLSHWVC